MLSRRALLASSLAAALPKVAAAQSVVLDGPNAIVGPPPAALADVPNFPSLTAALKAAPADNRPWRIMVGEIRSSEKVIVDRPNTWIRGLSPEKSQIVWDDYSGRTDPANASVTLGTRRSATITITAPDVRIDNLGVINSFDYPGQKAIPEGDAKKVHDTQALALAVSGNADRVTLDNVSLDGWQDTLFIDTGRALVRNSHIKGCVDFIFGAGTVALDHCRVTSRLMPNAPGQGYVCAPSTLMRTPMGFVFFDCTLDHEGEPFPDASTALARPWRPTTSFADGRYGNPEAVGACLYLRCAFGDHIAGKGFDHMGYNARGGVKAFVEPEDARFYISGCSGKAVATIPARFTAPAAMVAGLTPETLLGSQNWHA